MGWAVYYREFEIYPNLVPVRQPGLGIVGFQATAHVFRRGEHESPFVEVRAKDGVQFKDAARATEYIVSRVKGLIDGDEAALLSGG